MRVLVVGWLLFINLAMGHSAVSQNESEDVKQIYSKAKADYASGDYESAMAGFTQAYNLSGQPDLLYNLAVCAEKLDDLERAIAYYELYIEERPDADDIEAIKSHLEALQNPTSNPQDDPKVSTNPTSEAPAEPSAIAQPPNPAPPAKQTVQQTSTAPSNTAPQAAVYYHRQSDQPSVFWPGVTIGLGGLVMAGGVITGIMAHKKYRDLESSCAPECQLDSTDSVRALAIATDIQIGLGAVAIVSGVIALVVRKAKRKTRSTAFPQRRHRIKLGSSLIGLEGSF